MADVKTLGFCHLSSDIRHSGCVFQHPVRAGCGGCKATNVNRRSSVLHGLRDLGGHETVAPGGSLVSEDRRSRQATLSRVRQHVAGRLHGRPGDQPGASDGHRPRGTATDDSTRPARNRMTGLCTGSRGTAKPHPGDQGDQVGHGQRTGPGWRSASTLTACRGVVLDLVKWRSVI